VTYNQQAYNGDRFLDPETLYSDWKNELLEYKPGVNYTFEMIHDWYNRQTPGLFFRGQQTPIDWKSKIGNSDMSTNLKVERTLEIHKGDYVIREDGVVFLCSWNVMNHANNLATQSTECNNYLTFTRKYEAPTDENGFVIHKTGVDLDKRGRLVIVDNIPASWTLYQGRPDYSASTAIPGITPNDLITVSLQWNDKTKQLMIDDEFVIHKFTYRAVDISTAEVDIHKKHGVIVVYGKRVQGGVVNG